MVYLKLIDNYTISIYTAKELYNYKLHEAADKESASKQKKQELTAKLDSILAGHKEKGEELNEKFEVRIRWQGSNQGQKIFQGRD
mgnify:CR=1 FL=1